MMTFQCPTRSASLPSRDADRMLPSAAADITKPDTTVTCDWSATQLRDVDRDDRLDRHVGQHQQHPGHQHRDHRPLVGHRAQRPAPLRLSRLRRPPLLADQEGGRQEGHEDHRAGSQKVARMPISGGSTPPISGPTRLPAMIPEDSMPSAQPERAFGVCVATSTVEPEA